ncbi:general stress protein [Marinicrinis sediminis]|uniref:General stress protein n=1 Tax=Marinicrinis sediminis TaxID=1652465 RepID=A0ABW5R7I3_9BACL
MKPTVEIVDNGVQALDTVKRMHGQGIEGARIYVLAHEEKRTAHIADATDAQEIDIAEEGMFRSLANIFRSRGDELRSKLESVGLTEEEANHYEEVLDQGKVLVIATAS